MYDPNSKLKTQEKEEREGAPGERRCSFTRGGRPRVGAVAVVGDSRREGACPEGAGPPRPGAGGRTSAESGRSWRDDKAAGGPFARAAIPEVELPWAGAARAGADRAG